MDIVSVTRSEFKLDDGRVFPIDPPLLEDTTPEKFQAKFFRATKPVIICTIPIWEENPCKEK